MAPRLLTSELVNEFTVKLLSGRETLFDLILLQGQRAPRGRNWMDLLNWPLRSWIWFLVGLAGLLLLIWWIVRLLARMDEDADRIEAEREMFLAICELHSEGELTQEEFRSIKSQLDVRKSVAASDDSASTESGTSVAKIRPILQDQHEQGLSKNSAEIQSDKDQPGDSSNSDPVNPVN